MWARVVELMLAMWLLASPFIFDIRADARGWWVAFYTAAVLIMIISASSYAERLRGRYAYLANGIVGLGLVIGGYLAPETPVSQNAMIVGLLVAMMSIIPNDASQPPRSWRREAPTRTHD